jgi:hypothetical protein
MLHRISLSLVILAVGGCAALTGSRLDDGLVARYGFDGTASDLSGQDHHAVATGATYGADRHGRSNRALYLDGKDDFVTAPSSDILFETEVPREITVFLWFSVRDKAGGQIINEYASAGYDSTFPFQVQLSQKGVIIVEARHTRESHVTSSFVLADANDYRTGEWHSVAVVFDQPHSLLEGYFDGQFVSSSAINPTADYTDDDPIFIGTAVFGGVYHDCFDGAIDDVLIYNRALSRSEIRELQTRDLGR